MLALFLSVTLKGSVYVLKIRVTTHFCCRSCLLVSEEYNKENVVLWGLSLSPEFSVLASHV